MHRARRMLAMPVCQTEVMLDFRHCANSHAQPALFGIETQNPSDTTCKSYIISHCPNRIENSQGSRVFANPTGLTPKPGPCSPSNSKCHLASATPPVIKSAYLLLLATDTIALLPRQLQPPKHISQLLPKVKSWLLSILLSTGSCLCSCLLCWSCIHSTKI